MKRIAIMVLFLSSGWVGLAHAFEIDLFGGSSEEVEPTATEEASSAAAKVEAEQYQFSRSEVHQQWVLKCAKGERSGKEKCNLIHKINSKQGQQILKIEVLQSIAEQPNQMLFHLPLGTHLPAGALLKVGEVEQQMVILACLPAGCQAKTAIGINLHQALSREGKGVVQLLNQNRVQKIRIEFSLMGYAKGVEGVL